MTKAFFPAVGQDVPHKSEYIQFSSTLLRHRISFSTLKSYPNTQAKIIFVMFLWDYAVTHALLVALQVVVAFLPIRLIWIPVESERIEPLTAFDSSLSF